MWLGERITDKGISNGISLLIMVGIERLHLEQDAGKSIHDMDPHNTFVDLNRGRGLPPQR